jgi:hypothetical protein
VWSFSAGEKMTFDERIDKLTERHEALTLSVEMMGHRLDDVGKRLNDMITAMNQDAANIRSLVSIAERHEQEHEQLRVDLAVMNAGLDKHIGELVSGIGELCRRLPLPKEKNGGSAE